LESSLDVRLIPAGCLISELLVLRWAGCRPSEIIVVAVRWNLRFGLSHRDVGDLIQTRGRPFSTPLAGATALRRFFRDGHPVP
jgi:hypothetical protein